MKIGIFQRILRDNPVAASHYVQYLYSKQYIDELVDTLEYVQYILNNKILILIYFFLQNVGTDKRCNGKIQLYSKKADIQCLFKGQCVKNIIKYDTY